MGFIHQLADVFLHLDKQLDAITNQYGLFVYLLLFAIIFCETGLVVTPFLPGDSIVFAVGALVAGGTINPLIVWLILCLAAISGDTVNYQIGNLLKKKVANQKKMRFIKMEYIEKTQDFFKRYGAKTIVLSRFVPIVRTFAPFVAGVGEMRYRTFIGFNVIGGIAWVTLCLLGGFFFGNLQIVKNNFSLVILGIVLVSLLPGVVAVIKNKYSVNKA